MDITCSSICYMNHKWPGVLDRIAEDGWKNVELVAYLPKGFEFIKTNNAGRYDADLHAIFWSLEELPAQQTGTVQLTAMPTQMGQHKIRIESNAQMDLAATCDKESGPWCARSHRPRVSSSPCCPASNT